MVKTSIEILLLWISLSAIPEYGANAEWNERYSEEYDILLPYAHTALSNAPTAYPTQTLNCIICQL